jgi:hypothetical protein
VLRHLLGRGLPSSGVFLLGIADAACGSRGSLDDTVPGGAHVNAGPDGAAADANRAAMNRTGDAGVAITVDAGASSNAVADDASEGDVAASASSQGKPCRDTADCADAGIPYGAECLAGFCGCVNSCSGPTPPPRICAYSIGPTYVCESGSLYEMCAPPDCTQTIEPMRCPQGSPCWVCCGDGGPCGGSFLSSCP